MNNIIYLHRLAAVNCVHEAGIGMRRRVCLGFVLASLIFTTPVLAAETAVCGPNCVPVEVVAAASGKKGASDSGQVDWKWVLTSLASIAAFGLSGWAALRQRRGVVDVKIHDERIKAYQTMVNATAPLAIYFPLANSKEKGRLTKEDCAVMGRAASVWYFAHGAMLMSRHARDSYMRFERALTLASKSTGPLNAPLCPDDAAQVTDTLLDKYRAKLFDELEESSSAAASPRFAAVRELVGYVLDRSDSVAKAKSRKAAALASNPVIDRWQFGVKTDPNSPPQQRFRDYVFLQNLSSKLRTALAEDLRSRRRPE